MKTILTSLLLMAVTWTYAQTDSVSMAKTQRKIAAAQKEITSKETKLENDRQKLQGLEKSLPDLILAASDADRTARASADDYGSAATTLQGKAHQNKASRRAHRAANQATKHAKAAKKANEKVADTEKAISKLKSSIEKQEKAVNKLKVKLQPTGN